MLGHLSDQALSEINSLLKVDMHPNVLRYFAKEVDQNFVYLVIELCQGSLDDYLTFLKGKPRK